MNDLQNTIQKTKDWATRISWEKKQSNKQTNKDADELKCPGKSEVQDCDVTFVTTLTTRHQVIKTDDTVFLSLVASNKTFC
jgi:hypothetical protein